MKKSVVVRNLVIWPCVYRRDTEGGRARQKGCERIKYNSESYFFQFLVLLAKERGWVDNGGQPQKSDQQKGFENGKKIHTDEIEVKEKQDKSQPVDGAMGVSTIKTGKTVCESRL